MFHIGHLNILRKAKEQCDFLIVGVSTDELVLEYKHKKPVIPFSERIEIVRSVKYVDFVVAQTSLDKKSAWQLLHFNMLFHGTDWQFSELYKVIEEDMKSLGVEVVWIPHTDGISSSILREKVKNQ